MGATNALDRVAAMVGDLSDVSLDFKVLGECSPVDVKVVVA